MAGPRTQEPEHKSFSAPVAQAYGHETPLRNGTLGASFVSPSPLRTPPEGDVCERGLHHRPGKLGPAAG